MKKLFIITALLLSGSALYSQIQYGPGVRFGVKAGVNISNMTIKDGMSGIAVSPSYRLGYHISGIADIPISNVIYFQPGISLTEKGFKIDNKTTIDLNYNYNYNFGGLELTPEEVGSVKYSQKSQLKTWYIEVPLNMLLKFDAGNGKFLVGAGPYAAYGINGKAKSEIEIITREGSINQKGESDVFDEEGANKFDYGFNFLTGYELNNGLFLHGGYGLGLGKLNDDSEGTSAKHKLFTVSLGFLF